MEKIVTLKNLCKKYGKQCVLDVTEVEFAKGKIYGIIGPNGAGKTTMFKLLAGLIQPTSGDMTFFEGRKTPQEARKKISFMIENPYLDLGMTAAQNMNMLAILYDAEPKNVEKLLKLVGLGKTGKKKVKNFSLGMKQRLGIAMALLKNPEMIILDEPMNGLDPSGIVSMRKLLENLCVKNKITIVISSHILSELELLVDVVYLIQNGKIIDKKRREELIDGKVNLEKYYMEKINPKKVYVWTMKIWKMQCRKIFYSVDYVGFLVVGSVLVILFGWTYVMAGKGMQEGCSSIETAVANAFLAMLLLFIGMYNVSIAREYNEKTINYEKIHEVGTVSMILGRMVIPIVNTTVFCLVILVAVLIEGKLKQLLSISYLEQIAWKIIETFACVFRLNVAAGLVFIGVGNALWASLLTLMIQWGLGNVFAKKLFCADQISVIWGQSAENNIMLNIFSGF